MINTTWTEFKDLLTRDRITLEYTTDQNYYVLYGTTKNIQFTLTLNKDTDDYDDFEANYLANANVPASQLVVQKPLADRDNHTFDGQGFTKVCPAGVTEISYTIVNESDMSGVEIIGAEAGDKVQMQVRDTPNGDYTLAQTEALDPGNGVATPNAILNQYGTNWYVRPDVFLKVIPYGARVLPGMVVVFVYENNGQAGKNIYVNLDLHKLINPN